jgi:REP element-mobilizing transposase RayT
MSTGYQIKEQEGAYYLTLQVVGWIDIFTRQVYKDIILQNLRYCQQNKGLTIFAFVIMSNHIHMLVQSQKAELSNTLRDFKSYTSKVIIETIKTENESRREWMLNYFENAAKIHVRNIKYQFWTHENHSEHIYTDKFVRQKLEYIHNNPVRSGIVRKPEEYIYSSASNYSGLESVLEIDILTTKWKTYS